MSDPTHTEPVRQVEARAGKVNPAGAMAPLTALRTVILYTFTDAFGLVAEESMWTGYHLDDILAPLLTREPSVVPLSVRQEMLEGTYTRALEMIEARDDRSGGAAYDADATRADVNDWAGVTMQMISECYQMRQLEESAMHGKIVGLLRELGVDDPTNPRPSRYLPNDVRHRLNNKTG